MAYVVALSTGAMAADLLHFSLYAVLSYQQPAVQVTSAPSPSSAQPKPTPVPVTQPQTTIPNVPSQVTTTTPPPTAIGQGDSGAPIGAIAGGAVGGIAVIGMVAFAYHRYLRRQPSARVEPIQAIKGSGSDEAANPLLGEGVILSPLHRFSMMLLPGEMLH